MESPLKELWGQALVDLRQELSPIGYEAWINQLTPRSLAEGVLTLTAPDQTTKQTIEYRYLKKIQTIIKKVTGADYDVVIALGNQAPDGNSNPAVLDNAFPSHLRARYTFDTFVKGKSNELAFAASIAVAESPGKTTYNPLFLYGGVGLGKTHLMHSIGNYILDIDPTMKVLYTSSETLTNDFITSIRNSNMPQFREKYRNVDVLLVDDIQFLVDKERSQEEFFHTFNALFFANKQIVISSDKPPSELRTLEERLSSRFGSGLVVDITRPDYETRLAILESKAESEKIPIPGEVLQHLARNIASNIRELEGALNKVVAQAKLTKADITIDLAVEAIRGMTVTAEKREIDIPYIQETVAAFYSITPDDIRSKKRTANLSLARHVAMYLTRKILDSQLMSIGKGFGGRDHSTVVHAIDKITEEIDLNPDFENIIAELEKRIRERA